MWANGNRAPAPDSPANATYGGHGDNYGVIKGFNIFESYANRMGKLKSGNNATSPNGNLNQACVPNTICVYGKPQDKDMIFTIHAASEG
jgi:hypothetical protein